ncbi:MAG: hypothetical protein K0S28_382 [Paucimonas sp.]|jgi:hypothetical protein|nr:hypothetical protein [Paucimonas sp.]
MAANNLGELKALPSLQGLEATSIVNSVASIAASAFNTRIEAFTAQLAAAFLECSNEQNNSQKAHAAFHSFNLLKENRYAFYYVASERVEAALKESVQEFFGNKDTTLSAEMKGLSLVSFDEMDQKLSIGKASRSFENANADHLNSIGLRLAHLVKRDELPLSANPFRPEVFVGAMYEAWTEFEPDAETHPLFLPLISPALFVDLPAMYEAVNDALIARGVLPAVKDAYRIKKSNLVQEAMRDEQAQAKAAEVQAQLRKLLSPAHESAGPVSNPADIQQQVLQATAASNQLLGYLASLQKGMLEQQLLGAAGSMASNASILAEIKRKAPQGMLSRVDENAIDLLARVFDVVFADRHIPGEMKSLIGGLQVPVLKAALLDKEFFFEQSHPARQLIDLLTRSALAWDEQKGRDDPLYQAIEKNVERVQKDFDRQISVFAEVVSSIESVLREDEDQSSAALAEPISVAMRKEKVVQAKKAATHDVQMRIGTGEVVAFVETFLENKWVNVLTLAYSVKEQKPQVLESAVRTMDDLIWSVKPKITQPERKELIAKLPSMLAALNKWLDVIKLNDAERLQFFAELAECHASIVRAPLELTPERQIEIAMEVAKKAAERRREKEAQKKPEPVPDAYEQKVQRLERGTWFEFEQEDGGIKKVRLAWVSPLRSLYIFSTRDRKESFSLSAEELSACLRENRAMLVLAAGVVDRALAEAFAHDGANDPDIEAKSAA